MKVHHNCLRQFPLSIIMMHVSMQEWCHNLLQVMWTTLQKKEAYWSGKFTALLCVKILEKVWKKKSIPQKKPGIACQVLIYIFWSGSAGLPICQSKNSALESFTSKLQLWSYRRKTFPATNISLYSSSMLEHLQQSTNPAISKPKINHWTSLDT